MRNCFVPHCDAYCKKNGIIKRMMFSAPKDNFDTWKKQLFNKREFRETDRVCERHFDRSQILTHWEHIIDGKICQLEREKPKIRANAIPYLNLPETDDLAQIANKKRGPRKRKQNLNTSENDEKVLKKDKSAEFEAVANFDVDATETQTELRSSKTTTNGRKNAKETPQLSTEEKRQMFDTVYDEIYEVVLPNTLWGIHRDPEDRQFIAFTMFDANKMTCSVAVKVTDAFELKVYNNGTEQSTEVLRELSVDTLTKLLNQLNENTNVDSK